MNEYIEEMISKARKVIGGRVMYDGELIQKLNEKGVKFTFLSEGIRWSY
jgi:hypothetical protein